VTGLVVTGLGRAEAGCDPRPFLKVRKMRKYMGVQDALATVAAGEALRSAGFEGLLGERAERTGMYLAVGYIPFEQSDIDRLLNDSVDEQGAFSTARFATGGYEQVNPLITFRCLSNMPAFHVSTNFDVQGPYLTTYPGPGQLYQALEEAACALRAGAVDLALVGGVAHQDNFLVRHHFFARMFPPVDPDELMDGAGFLVLETAEHAAARGASVRARLREHSASYFPFHPFEDVGAFNESFEGVSSPGRLGPASLPVALCQAGPGQVRHYLQAHDGIRAESTWEVLG